MNGYQPTPVIPPERWWSETESPKAWMSVRDADLYEELLHRLAVRRDGEPLRVLEWGAGRSTSWYPAFLDALGVDYRWLVVEHDRSFVDDVVAPAMQRRADAHVVRWDSAESTAAVDHALVENAKVVVVAFNAGQLRPDLPGHFADRAADLDDYVELPQRLHRASGHEWDLAVVDGRKRRRCVLAAAEVLADRGCTMLHDAWRQHYQSAWRAYQSGRRVGDEWWIGSHSDIAFTDLLPWHAFERHQEPDKQAVP